MTSSAKKVKAKRWGKPEDEALLMLMDETDEQKKIDVNRAHDNNYIDAFWELPPFNKHSLVCFRDNVKKKARLYLANDALIGQRRREFSF
jgi:hypothetical protein